MSSVGVRCSKCVFFAVTLIALVASAAVASPRAGALLGNGTGSLTALQALLRVQVPAMPDAVSGDAGMLRVSYPESYDAPFVVEAGEQRIALHAIGADAVRARTSDGKVFYVGPHQSVDVVEVPGTARSEELLVLHDATAPRVFEYEIVEMRGVRNFIIVDGAIHFVADEVALQSASQIAGGTFTAPRPSLQVDKPWVIETTGRRSEGAAQWTIDGHTIRLTVRPDSLAYPLVVDPSFSVTGNMRARRYRHSSTLLPNGKVLVAGGHNGSSYNSTAELYDAAAGTFTTTTAMSTPRSLHTATLLPSGKVLIAGGANAEGPLNTAELYDPASGTFTDTGSMTAAREYHTATLLPNGKVLIAGGFNAAGFLSSAEIYDPAAGTFAATGSMNAARGVHTATLLPSGKVLIAGGAASGGYLNTAELYDDAAGAFTGTAGNMTAAREFHTATLLANGKVLLAGGFNGAYLNSAELYDPTPATFAGTGSMSAQRYSHTATLLANGKVLIASGDGANTAELYDPAGTFSGAAPMVAARYDHTASLLPNGRVLIVGGTNSTGYLNSAELYEPAAGTFALTGSMTGRQNPTATLLRNGKVLIAGGYNTTWLNTAVLYDPATGGFTATGNMSAARIFHTATLLPNGKVLIAGGGNSGGFLSTAELYDPVSGTFSPTGGMTSIRHDHTATVLPNGKVLITGGAQGSGAQWVNTAELYDPVAGTFVATGSMTIARADHTATLLATGRVLIAGGFNGSYTNTAELYDPGSGTFEATGNMTATRDRHSATLLPNGKVLLACGSGLAVANTAELYDPSAGTFTATGSLTSSQPFHTSTLLPNGKVLIAGGVYLDVLSAAELYDPGSGTFAATGNLMAGRYSHTATLLLNGKVLIAGGVNNSSGTSLVAAGELYDVGLGYTEGRRPVVSSLTSPVCQPANLALSGSLFTGDSEGSGGTTSSSAGNAPLLRLQRVDNDQFLFPGSLSFSAGSLFSVPLQNLPSGLYRAAVVSNAISGTETIVEVATMSLVAAYPSASVASGGSTTVIPSSVPDGYNGTLYSLRAAAPGFTGSLSVQELTGQVTVTNAGPVGTYTVTVSSSTACGSPSSTFTLEVIGPPASVTATGGTPQSTAANTPFPAPLQATVTDSAGHPLSNIAVTFTAPVSGASATFSGGGSALTGSSGVAGITPTANGILGTYNVTAIVGAYNATFSLTNTPAVPANIVATATTSTSVSVAWAGTAGATYEVVRFAAGGNTTSVGTSVSGSLTDNTPASNTAYLYNVHAVAPAPSPYGIANLATTVIFTDPSLAPGTTVRALHVTELRAAVEAVRALAALGAGTYTDPTLTPGVSVIRAAHVNDLRVALGAARNALFLPAVIYSHAFIFSNVTTISAVDVNELRDGVR